MYSILASRQHHADAAMYPVMDRRGDIAAEAGDGAIAWLSVRSAGVLHRAGGKDTVLATAHKARVAFTDCRFIVTGRKPDEPSVPSQQGHNTEMPPGVTDIAQARRERAKRLGGHIRYSNVDHVSYRLEGDGHRASVNIVVPWVEPDGTATELTTVISMLSEQDPERIALDAVSRIARYRLAHGTDLALHERRKLHAMVRPTAGTPSPAGFYSFWLPEPAPFSA